MGRKNYTLLPLMRKSEVSLIFSFADGDYSNQGSEGGRNPVSLGLDQSLESYTAQGYNPEDPHLRLGQVCDLGSN